MRGPLPGPLPDTRRGDTFGKVVVISGRDSRAAGDLRESMLVRKGRFAARFSGGRRGVRRRRSRVLAKRDLLGGRGRAGHRAPTRTRPICQVSRVSRQPGRASDCVAIARDQGVAERIGAAIDEDSSLGIKFLDQIAAPTVFIEESAPPARWCGDSRSRQPGSRRRSACSRIGVRHRCRRSSPRRLERNRSGTVTAMTPSPKRIRSRLRGLRATTVRAPDRGVRRGAASRRSRRGGCGAPIAGP